MAFWLSAERRSVQMPDNMAQASIEKLALEWPPERISALETATDPTEIRAGAFAR